MSKTAADAVRTELAPNAEVDTPQRRREYWPRMRSLIAGIESGEISHPTFAAGSTRTGFGAIPVKDDALSVSDFASAEGAKSYGATQNCCQTLTFRYALVRSGMTPDLYG